MDGVSNITDVSCTGLNRIDVGIMDELNKQCAEFLKWRQYGQSFHIPDGTLDKFHQNLYMRISDMHFHDSYDWAYLLLKLCIKKDCIWALSGIYDPLWLAEATPKEISQACLEVLRGE